MRGGERISRNRAARNRASTSRMRVGLHGLERSHAVSESRSPSLTEKASTAAFPADFRNEIKSQIVRAGFTMQEVVDRLADEYDWSDSVSNLSAKLQRESIRYKEVVELADVLDCDIVWVKRGERR